MKRLLSFLILIQISLIAPALQSFEDFIVSDIRIVGLQRVSVGSIFTAIPVSVGDKIDQTKVEEIIRALFITEQFNNIEIGRDANALIISIEERPSIARIDIDGNKAL